MTEPSPRGLSRRNTGLVVGGAAVILHLGVLRLGFTFDDWPLILDEPGLGELGHLKEQFQSLWRPLQRLSLALDHFVWGKDSAFGFHLTSLLWHVLACIGVWAVAWELRLGRWGALVAGLLFAVHPVHVEVVANISHRKESMALVFLCLALCSWLRAGHEGVSGRQRLLLRLLTGLLYLLAMLSKEVAAVMLPFAILALELLRAGEGSLRKRLPVFFGLIGPALVVLGVFAVWGDLTAILRRFDADDIQWVTSNQTGSYLDLFRTTFVAFATDVRLLVWPHPLSVDHPILVARSWGSPAFLAGCALVASLMAGVLLSARRSPMVCFGLIWFGVHLVPVSNLIPLTNWLVAERFLYVPSMGLALAVAVPLDRALRGSRSRLVKVLLVVLLLGFCALTVRQVGVWKDDQRLWENALAHNPGSVRAHHELGVVAERAGRSGEAESHYLRALELSPAYSAARFQLARLLLNQGRASEAFPHARALTQLRAHDPAGFDLLGSALLAGGNDEAAVPAFQRARELDPESDLAVHNFVSALLVTGKSQDAVLQASEAVVQRGSPLRRLALARSLAAVGRLGDAEQEFKAASEAHPVFAALPRFFGIFLVEQGRMEEGIIQLQRSLAIEPDQPQVVRLIEALISERPGQRP